jgi:hypothetical protein
MMEKPMNNLGFRFMPLYFRFCDYFAPPIKILERIGIQAGANVLDFGAGSGSYSIPAAQLVGPTGEVYASDIIPYPYRRLEKRQRLKGSRICIQYSLIAKLDYQTLQWTLFYYSMFFTTLEILILLLESLIGHLNRRVF